jgi:NTP pyrophosphatase (non-canonical NTP hydrolase)
MKYEELELNVIKWAEDKQIFSKSTALKQLSKTQEELDETLSALKSLHEIDLDREGNRELIQSDHDQREIEALFEAKDGIGDMIVTIIILAEMLGFSSVECLETAYNVIKNRKGEMINGLFVKEKV